MAFNWSLSPSMAKRNYFFEHLDKALDIYSNYENFYSQEISTQKLRSLLWISSYINIT